MTARVAGPLILVAAAALGCAQPQAPPGGEQDRIPPRVLSTTPAPFDTIVELDEPVVIRFNERISERLQGVADLADAVIVSPETGPVRVRRGRRSIEVSLGGGWKSGLVYRVVVLPVFRDMFNNQRAEPVELVFSTGAPIPETAIGGLLTHRFTGALIAGARVEATRRVDSITYIAVSDTGGFFALRNVPAGAYDLRAWIDQNRDRQPGFLEPRDTAQTVVGSADTVVVELALMPGDSTPARLARADPVDSVRVRLLFDDYFALGAVDGTALLYALPDSVLVSDEGTLIHGARLDSILAAERAVADSIAALERARADSIAAVADSIRADSLGIPVDSLPADTTAGPPPPDTAVADTAAGRQRVPPGRAVPPGQRPQPARPTPGQPAQPGQRAGAGARPPTARLPSQELVLVLPTPLTPGAAYLVVIRDVTNIHGIPGGGGSASFRVPEPPPDTVAAPPDTIPPDTIPAPGRSRAVVP